MINKKFEAYKLERELKRSGVLFEIMRYGKNKFGEPEGEPESVGSILGLYHEQNTNMQYHNGDVVVSRTEKIPMILCLYSSWVVVGAKQGDFIMYNGKKFIVVGCVNVQEWSIIGDVSLEVVDDGDAD